jgi:hypothetical protein
VFGTMDRIDQKLTLSLSSGANWRDQHELSECIDLYGELQDYVDSYEGL